jgi:hypothetical protein
MIHGRAAALIGCLWLASLAVAHAAEPFPGPASDHNGAAMCAVPIGTANAQVLVPATASSGRPWVLAASLYDLENPSLANVARTQHELVKQGFHVVAIEPGAILGGPDQDARWDAVYREMTARFGLSREVVLMGVGREGVPTLRWAAENPGKVSCLYLDKAVCHESQATASTLNSVALAEKLAAARVGIIYVAGGQDEIVPFAENGAVIQKAFESKGLFFRPLKQPTEGHHPHGLSDPREILRLIRMNTYAVPPTRSLVAYGPHFSQVLDFWKADSPEPTPVVVFIHGGGWGTGTRRGVGALEAYLKAGISVQEVKLGTMRNYLTESSPDFKQTLSELASLKSQLAKAEKEEPASKDASDYVARYREFKYQETMFELFAKQFELAKVDESREGAVIQVLDIAEPPERKAKPKKAIIAIIATLVSGFALLLFVFVRSALKNASQDEETKLRMATLRGSWNRALGI